MEVRIPGARPISRKPSKTRAISQNPAIKLQFKEWNNRFTLGQIPNYNPLTDKHCEGYRATLSRNKKVAVLAPGGVRKIKRSRKK